MSVDQRVGYEDLARVQAEKFQTAIAISATTTSAPVSTILTARTSPPATVPNPTPAPAEPPLPQPPLLALLEDLPDFFVKEVLGRLDPTDRAVLAQVGWPWLAAVVRAASEDRLPCAGKSRGVPLKLVDFVGSVARLRWAKVNGCPWGGDGDGEVANDNQ